MKLLVRFFGTIIALLGLIIFFMINFFKKEEDDVLY